MMKLLAGLIVLAALAMGAAMVVGGRVPVLDSAPMQATQVASPADSFVIHDAPPAATLPATPATPPPRRRGRTRDQRAGRRDRPAAGGQARRRPHPDATMTAPDTTPAATPATPDPLLAGPSPAPAILAGPPAPQPPPPPSWTSVTSQGARWRSSRDSLVIDMGGGRMATVLVDPAFLSLSQQAANGRIDFLKQTILENFPPSASQFRFARDGSVAQLR